MRGVTGHVIRVLSALADECCSAVLHHSVVTDVASATTPIRYREPV